ncbi:hypothetical protein [Desulfitobacterium chlororespirans]|nr:hypothetical protein [Desulfitobacterium chlororespirans]
MTNLLGFKGLADAQAVTDILIMFIYIGVWMVIFKGFKKSGSEAEKLYTV